MSMPPEKTYQAKLDEVLREAVDHGVDIGIIPAMMRPSVAKVPYLRHMGKVRSKSCVQCVEKGRVCRATNLSTERCWDCREERKCSWETDMRNKFPNHRFHFDAYAKAVEEDLIALPRGAVWGGKTEQPKQLRAHVPLNNEEESQRVDNGTVQRVLARLEAIEEKLDELLNKRKASSIAEPTRDSSPEPSLTQPSASAKRARRRLASSEDDAEPVAGPSGTRHSDDDA